MKTANESSDGGSGPIQFPPTLWTVVLEAKQADPERAQEAMGKLCVHYQEAIRGYFRLKCRHPQDAEDLAGDFMAHLLKPNRLASFDRDKCTRFRRFLSTALKNFFLDWLRKKKPEPDSIEEMTDLGLDFPITDPQLERAFDSGFAGIVHRRVMDGLEKAATDSNRFKVLRYFVPFEHGQVTYEELASRLKLSGAAMRKAVFNLRKKYVQQFRDEVAPTVINLRTELDSEVSLLLDLLPEAVGLDSQKDS